MKTKGTATGLACVLVGCATAGAELCEPTGWVDRVEAGYAVVAEDGKEEEAFLPVDCFPESVTPGTRVVDGRVDWEETAAVAAEIAQMLAEMEAASP